MNPMGRRVVVRAGGGGGWIDSKGRTIDRNENKKDLKWPAEIWKMLSKLLATPATTTISKSHNNKQ